MPLRPVAAGAGLPGGARGEPDDEAEVKKVTVRHGVRLPSSTESDLH
jgi:hypothetical protein